MECGSILKQESEILDLIIEQQKLFRSAINERAWDNLTTIIGSINLLMDKFNSLDSQREKIALRRNTDSDTLADVRGKLLKVRAYNKSLSNFIYIARGFVQNIIDEALPQKSSRVYSKSGVIVNTQPQSVLVDTLS